MPMEEKNIQVLNKRKEHLKLHLTMIKLLISVLFQEIVKRK